MFQHTVSLLRQNVADDYGSVVWVAMTSCLILVPESSAGGTQPALHLHTHTNRTYIHHKAHTIVWEYNAAVLVGASVKTAGLIKTFRAKVNIYSTAHSTLQCLKSDFLAST